MIEIQLLIMFYKNELKESPDCLASKVMLDRNRAKLREMEESK